MHPIQRPIEKAVSKAVSDAENRFEALQRENVRAINDLRGRLDKIAQLAHTNGNIPAIAEYRRPVPSVIVDRPRPTGRPAQSPVTNGDISGVMQKILDAIAQFEAIGVDRVPKVQAAFMAGYSNLASKSFANAMGALRSGGYIVYPDSDSLSFTDSGRALASPVDSPLSTEELQRRIVKLLGGVHGNIVGHLVDLYPDEIAKEELAQRCGYTNVASKSFANAIGRLRTLGFVDYPQSGYAKAASVLFLES
jgi:Mn-dependent DtxR family transcriptional regulator